VTASECKASGSGFGEERHPRNSMPLTRRLQPVTIRSGMTVGATAELSSAKQSTGSMHMCDELAASTCQATCSASQMQEGDQRLRGIFRGPSRCRHVWGRFDGRSSVLRRRRCWGGFCMEAKVNLGELQGPVQSTWFTNSEAVPSPRSHSEQLVANR
jgi:hypothetical protein